MNLIMKFFLSAMTMLVVSFIIFKVNDVEWGIDCIESISVRVMIISFILSVSLFIIIIWEA